MHLQGAAQGEGTPLRGAQGEVGGGEDIRGAEGEEGSEVGE